jgi:uncharacterized protein YeaO (DUF488 family)
MSSRLKEASISSVSSRYDEGQHTFDNFGIDTNSTTIAVVSLPTERMREVTDECFPELGMPEKYLSKFLKLRNQYRKNSAIDEPANRAYTELSLDERYVEYIRNSGDAQIAITQIMSRIESGETITVVCYEESHEMCHRHVLIELIENRMQSDFSFSKAVAP